MRHLLIILLFVFFAFNAHSQITGIKIEGDTCNSLTLSLQALGTSSSPFFFWNFDDPASGANDTITITGQSFAPFPTHTFSSPGVYNVCVTFQEPGFPLSTVCRSISIGLCCNGIISSQDTCLQNNIPFSIVTGATITSVNWNFGDPSSGANNTSTSLSPSHLFSAIGNYNVTANVVATCGSFQVDYSLQIINCSTNCTGTILSNDSCLLNGTSFQVLSNSTINSIVWNFGDPANPANNTSTNLTPTHLFSAAGNYIVSADVLASCGSFQVDFPIQIVNCSTNCTGTILNNDTCLANGTTFQVVSNNTINSIEWNFDDPLSGANNSSTSVTPTHLFSDIGTYNVRSIVNFTCGVDTIFKTISIVDCDSIEDNCQLYVPNVFTPNADGINDEFYSSSICPFEHYEMVIFNRWGVLMFKTSNQLDIWDGKYKGSACSNGVYAYVITSKIQNEEMKVVNGTITLVK